jgi:hypothetical protein
MTTWHDGSFSIFPAEWTALPQTRESSGLSQRLLRLRGQQAKSSIVKLDRIELAEMLQRQIRNFTLLHWAQLGSNSFGVTIGIQEYYAKQIGLLLQRLRITRFDFILFYPFLKVHYSIHNSLHWSLS